MITKPDEHGVKLIVCDKCGNGDILNNESLFAKGWSVNKDAKKYFHICYECKTKKQKSATDFVKKLINK